MRVEQAKAVARAWVAEQATRLPGFCGAFFHGSTNWLPDDALLPPSSDVDIMVVLDDSNPPVKLGKFLFRDVLLEASYLPRDQIGSPEQVLANYHLAGSFRAPGIIADPSGELQRLQAAVSRGYAQRRWVQARCAHARDNILRNIRSLSEADPFHDRVMGWLFAAGVTTHVLLVAGLRNPTVRQRYLAVRGLLREYGRDDFYEPLLELLGCAHMSRERAAQHLGALAAAFDAAAAVIKTPFFFASDLSAGARPIAIDGSAELIERGDQREAVFWMVATSCRCQKVFAQDAPPDLAAQFEPGFRRLVGDLGIASFADIRRRGEQIERLLPEVWRVAEEIMDANPGIDND
jgi:hypothetical protein